MPHDRIQMNPEIMTGKPVIRGTRFRLISFCASLALVCCLKPSLPIIRD